MELLFVSPNTQVTQMMLNQSFDPWTRLGVTQQCITQPIEPLQKIIDMVWGLNICCSSTADC
jgi:hypothetical protein